MTHESGNAAKLERRTSRRPENAASGVNDWDQDYTDDYPTERDSQAEVDAKTKTHGYTPCGILTAYFKKWRGGVDEVGAAVGLAVTPSSCTLYTAIVFSAGLACSSHPRYDNMLSRSILGHFVGSWVCQSSGSAAA